MALRRQSRVLSASSPAKSTRMVRALQNTCYVHMHFSGIQDTESRSPTVAKGPSGPSARALNVLTRSPSQQQEEREEPPIGPGRKSVSHCAWWWPLSGEPASG